MTIKDVLAVMNANQRIVVEDKETKQFTGCYFANNVPMREWKKEVTKIEAYLGDFAIKVTVNN